MSRSLLSNSRRFPRGSRAFSLRESLFASRQGNDLDSDVENESRRKPELLWLKVPARFRRLFTGAQSTAALKLANPLTKHGFLVLREPAASPVPSRHGLAGLTAEIMTKACASGQSSVMLR